MKLINMIVDGKPRLGILTEKGVVDVSTVRPGSEIPCTMMEAIRMGRENALPLLQMAENLATHYLDESTITYAPAVDAPSKILCAGVNYRAHIEETKGSFEPAGVPTIFAKFNNTLAPHRGKVIRCRSSKKHDYEAEIAVIISKRASYITLDQADEHIFGYTLANDISARDLQKATSQWVPGKTCDTFCPLGPCIVTADALDFDKMHITGYKNGELRQEGWSADMIHDIPALVTFLSGCCTLEPGDVILTGTPSGVILGRPEDQQDWLQPGDVLTVKEDTIGELTVTIQDS
ncbi:MAG: fumarylacetoacetate hydrolase family protein [Oscillospiraceae bacterium]|nr:fumarylacetoacetate hydrolase family protein [Oscillospiraceae bacterium]